MIYYKQFEWVTRFISEANLKYGPVKYLHSELLNILFIVNLN